MADWYRLGTKAELLTRAPWSKAIASRLGPRFQTATV